MRTAICYGLAAILFLVACNNGSPDTKHETSGAAADSAATAGYAGFPDLPAKQIIKTADLECRVSDIHQAVVQLEQLVNNLNGLVAESNLQNEITSVNAFSYSHDSLKQVKVYSPRAQLTLKVPVQYLDSVVHTLSSLASFTTHRVLKQTDVSLQYLSNTLRNEAVNNTAPKTIAATSKNMAAIQYQDDKLNKAIDRKIENLQILNDIAYATITVALFQPQQADVQVIVNPDAISRAGFGAELGNAVLQSLFTVREVLVFFVQLWPLLLAAAVVVNLYKKRQKLLPRIK